LIGQAVEHREAAVERVPENKKCHHPAGHFLYHKCLDVPLRPIVFVCAALLLGAIFAAPFVPAAGFAFSVVCHQSAARCFTWFGGPMPVCARCLGVYAGLLIAAAKPLRLPPAAIWALAALNIVDWLFGVAPNLPRFLLGFALSWPAASDLLAFASRERTASN
jgi:hypothetical protein